MNVPCKPQKIQRRQEEIKEVASQCLQPALSKLPQDEYDRIYSLLGELISQWRRHVQAEQQFLATSFLGSIEKNFEELSAKHKSQCFVVALIALCKSGKSTLLNALMGCDYLPSHNLPETSRIVRVKHTVESSFGRLTHPETGTVIKGHEAIRKRLHELNEEAREAGEPSDAELLLEAPFLALEGKSFDKQSFAVLDTPGPNEAKCISLVKQVNEIIEKSDVILYLLDYTKLKTKEEETMFTTLRALRSDLCENFHDRLFLIVNKIDHQNRYGLTPKQTVKYIADLISNDIPELAITPERVLLVSAENALLARQVLNNTASEAAKFDFCAKLYGMMCEEDVSDEKLMQDAPLLLSRSGLIELEQNVLSFMFDNKAGILIDSVVGDALRHMCAFNNYLLTCRGALLSSKNEDEIEKLKADLKRILSGFGTVKDAFEGTKRLMEQWVDNRFSSFLRQCNSYLEETLTSPDYACVSFNKEDITYVLSTKSAELSEQLTQMFCRFKNNLEGEAFQQQQHLFHQLSMKIQPYIQEVEREVGEFLDISESLYPVSVEFPNGTREGFNTTINEELDMLVAKAKGSLSYEQHRPFAFGLCYWLKRKINIPVDMYTSDPTALLNYWQRLVEQNTHESARAAKEIVESKVSAALGVAEEYLKNYIGGYCNTIEYTIHTFNANETKRQNRLGHVNSLITDMRTGILQLISLCPKQATSDWMRRMTQFLDDEDEDSGLEDADILLVSESAVELPLNAEAAVVSNW